MVIAAPLISSSRANAAKAAKAGMKQTTEENPDSASETDELEDDEISEFPISALGSLGGSPFDFQPFLADPFSAALERMTLDPWTAVQRSVRADPFCPSYSSAFRGLDPFGQFGDNGTMFPGGNTSRSGFDPMHFPTNSPDGITNALGNLMNRFEHAKNPFAPPLAAQNLNTRDELLAYLEKTFTEKADDENVDQNSDAWNWNNPNDKKICTCKCGKEIGTCSCANNIPIPSTAPAPKAQTATPENAKPDTSSRAQTHRNLRRRSRRQTQRRHSRSRKSRHAKSSSSSGDESPKSRGKSDKTTRSKSRAADRRSSRSSRTRSRPKQRATKRRLARK